MTQEPLASTTTCSPAILHKRKHNSDFTLKTALTQAQAQGSKLFLFLVLSLMLAFALQQVEMKLQLRNNTSMQIF